MGCQKDIAKGITSKKADYVLAVKQNQKSLFEDITPYFQDISMDDLSKDYDWYQTVEKDHGRIEKRTYCTFSNMGWLRKKHHWSELNSVIQVTSERTIKHKTTKETRYFISSLANSAKKMGYTIRSHWGIENTCHWVLDAIALQK